MTLWGQTRRGAPQLTLPFGARGATTQAVVGDAATSVVGHTLLTLSVASSYPQCSTVCVCSAELLRAAQHPKAGVSFPLPERFVKLRGRGERGRGFFSINAYPLWDDIQMEDRECRRAGGKHLPCTLGAQFMCLLGRSRRSRCSIQVPGSRYPSSNGVKLHYTCRIYS